MDRGRSEAAERLRNLTRVAYTAAAGHLEVDPEEGQDRAVRAWPVRRAVVAVLVVLALVVGVLGARYLLTRPGPGEELTGDDLSAEADGTGATAGEGGAVDGMGDDAAGGNSPAIDAGADDATSDDATPADGAQPEADPGAEDASSAGGTPPGEELRRLPVVVHVAGAVARPGVVALEPGARLGDAVDAAGGALGEADMAAVNLARPLADGEQIYVPAVGEEPREPPAGPPAGTGPPGATAAGGPAGGGPGDEGAPADGTGSGVDGADPVVNLNQASAAELEELPGIGPALAGRIIAHREEIGGFTSADELDDVSGIGPVLMDQLRDLVTV